MNNPSRFTLSSQSCAVPFTRFSRSKFTVLNATGCVNPLSPSLSVLAIDGKLEDRGRQSILQVNVNPFIQTCDIVGQAEIGDTRPLLDDISPFLPGLLRGCPTLMLPGALWDEDAAVELCVRICRHFDDGVGILESVKRFPKDPWKRVASEIDIALASPMDAPPVPVIARLDEAGARELAALLLDPEAAKAELQAFRFTWNEAIELKGGGIMSKMTMPFDEFAKILRAMALSCRVPEIGQ